MNNAQLSSLTTIGINVSVLGLTFAGFGFFPRLIDTSEKIGWGGMYVCLFANFYRFITK